MNDPSRKRRQRPRSGGAKRKSTKPQATRSGWRSVPPALLAIFACGTFLFLILAGLGVRLLIFREQPEESPAPEPTADSQHESPVDEATVPPTSLADLPSFDLMQLPDESEYEVLPPPAAKKKNRRLPGILYVGDEPGTFTELHDALAVAIEGDVIEIRTNRPLYLQSVSLDKTAQDDDEKTPAESPWKVPLVVRSGHGFQPHIRHCGIEGSMISLTGKLLWLQGLHFQAALTPGNGFSRISWLSPSDSRIHVQQCSFNLGQMAKCLYRPQAHDTDTPVPPKRRTQLVVDRCLLRAAWGVRSAGEPLQVAVVRSAAAFGGRLFRFSDGSHEVVVRQSTFLHVYLTGLEQASSVNYSLVDSIVQNLWCCPELLQISMQTGRLPVSRNEQMAVVARNVPKFKCTGNLLQFHDVDDLGWGRIGSEGQEDVWLKVDDWREIRRQLHSVRFGDRIEQFRESQNDQTREDAMLGRVHVLPLDLQSKSPDRTIQRRIDRGLLGCIPQWLPVPPAASVQPYAPPPRKE